MISPSSSSNPSIERSTEYLSTHDNGVKFSPYLICNSNGLDRKGSQSTPYHPVDNSPSPRLCPVRSSGGPNTGSRCLRYVVTTPFGFLISAAVSVSDVTRLPCSSQHKPMPSYLDSRR